MNPPCARCNKIVYPVEKLSCLDKYWHKGCFKCTHCDLTLTMKNYKGYDKKPYCPTHYPQQKFTMVADTPENKRLAQLTQNISNIQYHKQFNEDRKNQPGFSDTYNNAPPAFETREDYNSNNYNRRSDEYPPSNNPRDYSDNYNAPSKTAGIKKVNSNARQVLPSASTERAPQVVKEQVVKYRCLYDYAATDDDEVSFMEGDVIINGEIIDQGWMTGTVERTGEQGMLPFNYVEQI